MKKIIALLATIFMALTIASAPSATASSNPKVVQEALASVTQSAMSAVHPMATSPIRTVRALANGQTVQTFKYHTQHPDEIGDVYFDSDWLQGGTRPAVVVVHGGWWHNGTRANEAVTSQRFLDAGFVVFNIEYRVAADHAAYAGSTATGTVLGSRWPAQRIDAALAYDWLKANAAQFNVDPDRVAIYGSSAGGHIAHITSGFYGTSRYKASVSVGGVMQPTRVAEIVMNGTYGGVSSTSTYAKSFGYMTSTLGCSYEPTWYDCGNKWRSFKPDGYLGATKPPIYVVKGENDPIEPTAEVVASLTYWINYFDQDGTIVVAPNRGHEETSLTGTGTEDNARWNAMITWLRSKTA